MTASGRPNFATRQVGGIVEMAVTGRWSSAAAEAFESEKVDRLLLHRSIGWDGSLDFLHGMPVRGLDVADYSLTDLEPIYSLSPTLTDLSLATGTSATVDLARLENLRSLGALWTQVSDSIAFASNVETLYLVGFSRPDLTPLAVLRSLAELTVKDCPRLRSLHGLSELTAIHSLNIAGARSLADLAELRGRRLLRVLQLEGCRRIPDIADLDDCVGLTFLNLGDCGDIPTIAPIGGMKELEDLYLYESTRVLDGDLSPVLGLPKLRDLRMRDRRGYSPSVAAICEQLARA